MLGVLTTKPRRGSQAPSWAMIAKRVGIALEDRFNAAPLCCWGGMPDRDAEARDFGANTNGLISPDGGWDRYSGISTMSNLPVDVVPL
jgi:hypothetical protein